MVKILVREFFNIIDREGDDPSLLFKSYYEETKDFVRTVIYWNTRLDNIDDLVQETYLKAWKSFSKFEKRSSFKTWIYRIAINVARDNIPKKVIKLDVEISHELNIELKDIIDRSLLGLSTNQKELFILFYKLDYSFREISELTNQAESTVKSKVYKAKEIFIKTYNKLENRDDE